MLLFKGKMVLHCRFNEKLGIILLKIYIVDMLKNEKPLKEVIKYQKPIKI